MSASLHDGTHYIYQFICRQGLIIRHIIYSAINIFRQQAVYYKTQIVD